MYVCYIFMLNYVLIILLNYDNSVNTNLDNELVDGYCKWNLLFLGFFFT